MLNSAMIARTRIQRVASGRRPLRVWRYLLCVRDTKIYRGLKTIFQPVLHNRCLDLNAFSE